MSLTEASPTPECVPVDPVTLPKGVAEFEAAFSTLQADVAQIEDRVVAAMEADKKKSVPIATDLQQVGYDFGNAVIEANLSKELRKLAEKGLGQFIELEFAAMMIAGGPLEDALPMLALPDSNAAMDQFRAAVGYWWPCQPTQAEIDARLAPSPEPVIEPPGPDTVAALLATKIDTKATFDQVERKIDLIFGSDRFAGTLSSLGWKKQASLSPARDCQKKGGASLTRLFACTDGLLLYLSAAQQLRDDDPVRSDLSRAFVDLAQTLRSAAVNDGVLRKSLDQSLKQDAEQLELE